MAIPQVERRGVAWDDEVIGQLRTSLRGELILPEDAGYDEARKVWNGMIDKFPAVIVRCTGTADVVAALGFARERNLQVAVRGGGHNVAGSAVNDGGLVVDLSPMRGIQVDPGARLARVQPGADWGDLDRETQLHGLMTPGGVVSTTGVAGFTLAGGMGLSRRKWGLACDNLVSAQIVIADGRVLTASETEHPDLFWAIRGGGGNFGIVTWFELRLHRLGPELAFVAPVYPLTEATGIVRAWREYVEQAPDEVSSDVAFWSMPPLPDLPPGLVGVPIIIVPGWYAGAVGEGQAALQPLRELGQPLVDLSHVGRYVDLQATFDPFFPDTQRYYWKSLYANTLGDEVIAAMVALAADRPSPQTLFALRSLGGAIGRVPEEATAYGNRAALYNLSIDTTWQDPGEDERMIAWTRAAWARMRALTQGGVYLNFAGLGEDNDTLARAGYGRNYERLVEVKRRYDPTNFFRGNINIAP